MASMSSKYNPLTLLKGLFTKTVSAGADKSVAHFEKIRTEEKAFTSIDRGTSLVPLAAIVGSVGRYHDFDAQFKPRGYDSDERLKSITREMRKGRSFPPISLYQIKDNYYILDGHHRFTAAKDLGHDEIKACIQELLPSKDTLENRLYIERTEFRDRYGLPRSIKLTAFGQFKHLEEQITEHHEYLREEQGQEISVSQAAVDWFNTIYLPLRKLIEKSRLAESFKDRTTDDLYLYISHHQWTIGKSRQYGIGIDKLIPKNMEEFRTMMAQQSEKEYPEMRREINAFILMNVEGRREARIMDKLFELEEVQEIHSVHGSIDIIVRIKLLRDLLSSDAELISQFTQTTVRQWNGVISTQTLLPGVSRVKKRD
jgi:hypothetical protein